MEDKKRGESEGVGRRFKSDHWLKVGESEGVGRRFSAKGGSALGGKSDHWLIDRE